MVYSESFFEPYQHHVTSSWLCCNKHPSPKILTLSTLCLVTRTLEIVHATNHHQFVPGWDVHLRFPFYLPPLCRLLVPLALILY